MPKSSAILTPNLGLYLGTSPLTIPARGLQDGLNFRVKQGKIEGRNLGWSRFSTNWTLNGPVTFIDNFFPAGLTENLIFGTLTDIYLYDAGTDTVSFITPQYTTGTAAASGTAVTGTGTLWQTAGIKAGDEITFGTAGETDPAATWFTVASVTSETAITLTGSAGTVADGVYTIRRKFQGQVSDIWSIDVFVGDGTSGDDLWFGTNGVDSVVTWNGSDTAMTLHAELGFTCKSLSVYSNMMIYANITQGGSDFSTSIINSDVGRPLNAGSTGTGLSEQFKVHGGTDAIENMVPLGDNLVIYSSRHVTLAQFVGDPFVFAFRSVAEGIGTAGPNAIADFGDVHTFVSADAQYEFDGVNTAEVNSHVWRELIRTMDPGRKFRIYAHFDEENGDLIWSTPLTTDASSGNPDGQSEFAYSEHYLEDIPPNVGVPYSKRQFPFLVTGFYEKDQGTTWSSLTQSWSSATFSWNDQFFLADFPQNIAGDENGIIWVLNEVQTGNGANLLSFVKTGRFPTGSGRERNLLRRVYPFIEPNATPNAQLEIGVFMSDYASSPSNLTETFLLEMSDAAMDTDAGYFASVFRAGRFFELSFGTDGEVWVFNGYDIDLTPGGVR